MDFSKYDRTLQDLHQKHQEYLKSDDKRAVTVLRKMLQQAQLLRDQELMGYTYHSLAFAEHFIMGRYGLFLKYLAQAARCLLRLENQSEMLHVYYLVAIDAMNKGLSDMAVHYFHEARSIAEITGQQTSAAILDQSIGHIYLQLGQYQIARRHIRDSMAMIKKDKSHPHYFSNLTANYMNDVFACLELGKIDQAKSSFQKVRTFMEKHPNEFRGGTHLHFEMLRLRLALTEDNHAEAREAYTQVTTLMRENSVLHLFMDEIRKLSDLLIQRECFSWMDEILSIIDENGISDDALDALEVLTGIKIKYYMTVDAGDKLLAAYQTQGEIQELSLQKQETLSNHIAEFVNFTTALRKDREAILARQDVLITMAESDPLTGIANRYRTNLMLDEAFERAYHAQTKLGIVYLDVDGLKDVNDRGGHLAGDQYLIDLAQSLQKEAAVTGCFPSRFGGDEFVVIFENKKDRDIRDYIARVKKDCTVSFSSGFYNAVPREKVKNWYFLERADRELYKEKRRKKASR